MEIYTELPSDGIEEGEVCGRNGCDGIIKLPPVEGCTCFNCAPCSQCFNNKLICPTCGWEEEGR